MRTLGAFVAGMMLALLMMAGPAWAQEADALASTVVDVQPIIDAVVGALAALLLAVGTWAAKMLGDRLGLAKDSEVRGYLETAIQSGIGWGKEKALALGHKDFAKIDVRNQVVAAAVSYVVKATPDALRRFGLTDDRLRELVLARLPAAL